MTRPKETLPPTLATCLSARRRRSTGRDATIAAAEPDDQAIPGIAEGDRARLNLESRTQLVRAIEGGARPETLVSLLEVDAVRLETRRTLALEYRSAGLFSLARRIEEARVPVGHVLLVTVADEVAVNVVPLAALGIEATPRPAVLVLADPSGAA
jgi:hypothetical protein